MINVGIRTRIVCVLELMYVVYRQDYIKSLIEVLNQAEDLESLENLHALCSVTQTIRAYSSAKSGFQNTNCQSDRPPVTLNDHSMYEHILEDDIFFGVVGMLECPFIHSPWISSIYILTHHRHHR